MIRWTRTRTAGTRANKRDGECSLKGTKGPNIPRPSSLSSKVDICAYQDPIEHPCAHPSIQCRIQAPWLARGASNGPITKRAT